VLPHELTVPEAVSGTIAVLLLVVQLALFRTVVISELIRLYAIQSAFVAAICFAVGVTLGAWDLLALAVLTLILKVFVLPAYMQSLVRTISTRVELPARINVLLP
jgi:hydrogenase-4 membrane subunit HyfE